MEKNHKNNTDCYFFYYSTCTKGDSCPYRHEVSALGSETVCSYWQQGSCINQHCNLRHMEIKKNRKVIPCYWEKFPAGCKKPHCPFLHRLSRSNIANPIEPVKATPPSAKHANQEWTNRPDAKFDGNSTESEQGRGSSETGSFIGSPVVDPLIVNFDEAPGSHLPLAPSLQTSLSLPPPPQPQQPPPPSPAAAAAAAVAAVASSLGIPSSNSLTLPSRSSLASSQSSPCHHRSALSFGPAPPPPPPHHHPHHHQQQQQPPPPQLLHNLAAAAAAAAHHHQARTAPSLSPLQPPPPHQPSQQPSSPLLQRPSAAAAYSGLHSAQQATAAVSQAQAAAASRFPFPFLSFASYRRF